MCEALQGTPSAGLLLQPGQAAGGGCSSTSRSRAGFRQLLAGALVQLAVVQEQCGEGMGAGWGGAWSQISFSLVS